MSPVLAGRFPTTGPPEKSWMHALWCPGQEKLNKALKSFRTRLSPRETDCLTKSLPAGPCRGERAVLGDAFPALKGLVLHTASESPSHEL